jgi:hypothetical protein
MIIQLQFSEIMGCANLFQRFLTFAVYCVSTPSILLTRDLACAQMKFHKHMRDLLHFLPLQMFDITQYLTKIKCHQFIYLFKFKS